MARIGLEGNETCQCGEAPNQRMNLTGQASRFSQAFGGANTVSPDYSPRSSVRARSGCRSRYQHKAEKKSCI